LPPVSAMQIFTSATFAPLATPISSSAIAKKERFPAAYSPPSVWSR